MALVSALEGKLRLPVVGAPLFIVSGPELVIAQCKAGIVGSFPALNARPQSMLGEWLTRIKDELAEYDEQNPDSPSAPYAVNQICHASNDRLMDDMATCVEHEVPIIITSLRPPQEIVREVKEWFDGTILLSGSIGDGHSIAGALAMGADLAYLGTRFIATEEANADKGYKDMLIESAADDIVYSSLFTGINGNYLKPSIAKAGLDPDNLPGADKSKMNFGSGGNMKTKAWKDIWGSGQGIGGISDAPSVEALVRTLKNQYDQAFNEMVEKR